MASTITEEYLMGILEGRKWFREHGAGDRAAILDNLDRTIGRFDARSPVGQMLRGERDFWRRKQHD